MLVRPSKPVGPNGLAGAFGIGRSSLLGFTRVLAFGSSPLGLAGALALDARAHFGDMRALEKAA